jgi:capsular exopolysaccharide synthesis family protein
MTSNPKIITMGDPRSPVAEQYRILRTNLQFMMVEGEVKTVVVTSTNHDEGKTTIAANLALVMAQAGSKVLLIDCDLRKPCVHKIFDKKANPGLTNYFAGDDKELSVIIQSTEIDSLSIITSGSIPPNPSEILSSSKMKAFLEEVSKDYNFVIIDSPPSGVFTDAAVISTMANGVIYICASGQVKRDHARKTIENFKKINARVLGVVLNKIPNNYAKHQYYYNYSDNETG